MKSLKKCNIPDGSENFIEVFEIAEVRSSCVQGILSTSLPKKYAVQVFKETVIFLNERK